MDNNSSTNQGTNQQPGTSPTTPTPSVIQPTSAESNTPTTPPATPPTPTAASPASEPTTPTPEPTPTTTATPPTPTPTSEPTPAPANATPKKKRTGLIAGIIALAVILVCGIAFAVYAVIKNQIDNVAAESFTNLINAKQVAVTGTINYTPKGEYTNYIGPINITLNSKVADVNRSSEVGVTVDLQGINKTIELSFSDVFLKDGVIYVKASGIAKLYNDVLSEIIDSYLESYVKSSLSSRAYLTCSTIDDVSEYFTCMENAQNSSTASMEDTETINSLITETKTHLNSIITKVDDQWFKISLQEILDSELVSQSINTTTKESISKSYDCSIDMVNNISRYSNEFSDLYSKNQFIKLEPSDNSLYKVSLDAEKTANYINAIPKTQVFANYAACSGNSLGDSYSEVSADNIANSVEGLPSVYVRFDGFLTHHLTELIVEEDNEYLSTKADLHFAYPSNLVVTAPSESTPIMELVQFIIDEVSVLSNKF